ncbi:MAG: hypothetical protein IMF01_07310, partial [Proteobacteria bacterium]|nr:hypothetical protein [Pseudomonadota bacterium]
GLLKAWQIEGLRAEILKLLEKVGMIEKARNDLKAAVKYDPKYAPVAKDLLKKFLAGRRDF